VPFCMNPSCNAGIIRVHFVCRKCWDELPERWKNEIMAWSPLGEKERKYWRKRIRRRYKQLKPRLHGLCACCKASCPECSKITLEDRDHARARV
jgi:hypothetical protein